MRASTDTVTDPHKIEQLRNRLDLWRALRAAACAAGAVG